MQIAIRSPLDATSYTGSAWHANKAQESKASIPWGKATFLMAALTGAQQLATNEVYARHAATEFLRGHLLGGSLPTLGSMAVPQANTSATTLIRQPDAWDELTELEEDWDGQGARRVDPDAVANAKIFLSSLPLRLQDFVPFADIDGGVGLKSQRANKSAYIIVSPTNLMTYVIKVGATIHRGHNSEPQEMKELLGFLY